MRFPGALETGGYPTAWRAPGWARDGSRGRGGAQASRACPSAHRDGGAHSHLTGAASISLAQQQTQPRWHLNMKAFFSHDGFGSVFQIHG